MTLCNTLQQHAALDGGGGGLLPIWSSVYMRFRHFVCFDSRDLTTAPCICTPQRITSPTFPLPSLSFLWYCSDSFSEYCCVNAFGWNNEICSRWTLNVAPILSCDFLEFYKNLWQRWRLIINKMYDVAIERRPLCTLNGWPWNLIVFLSSLVCACVCVCWFFSCWTFQFVHFNQFNRKWNSHRDVCSDETIEIAEVKRWIVYQTLEFPYCRKWLTRCTHPSCNIWRTNTHNINYCSTGIYYYKLYNKMIIIPFNSCYFTWKFHFVHPRRFILLNFLFLFVSHTKLVRTNAHTFCTKMFASSSLHTACKI